MAKALNLSGCTGVQIGDNPQMHVHMRTSSPPWWTRSGYIEQVRDIAPGGGAVGALRDRDAELAVLTQFCGGSDAYLWLRAGPWAGKSALLSTFVLRPPPQVEVVSFFITGRLAAQSDSSAFTDMLIDQLTAIIGESAPSSLTVAARDAHRRALLRAAAEKLQSEGRRLVLVIDGLDEDRGGRPGSGLASIASLLPKVCEDSLRIIVASRPDPHLPIDVPADHPLRGRCATGELEVSAHASEVKARASQELQDLLHGDQIHQDILGLIAACGGGLAMSELEELTGMPPYLLDGILGGFFGRTVGSRSDDREKGPSRVYLFTHEALRETTIKHLGVTLQKYESRIHGWADKYRQPQGKQPAWPSNTPQYLIRGYVRMLIQNGDTERLAALATDSLRHDCMLNLLGGDSAALAEVRASQQLILAQGDFQATVLIDLARLAHRRGKLEARNSHIPSVLPAIWASIGQPVRAEGLAMSFASPALQSRALAEIVKAFGSLEEYDRSNRTIQQIVEPAERARAQAALVWQSAASGNFERAESIARLITHERLQERAMARVAQALNTAGLKDRAERIFATIIDSNLQERAQRVAVLKLAWDAADPAEEDWSLESTSCSSGCGCEPKCFDAQWGYNDDQACDGPLGGCSACESMEPGEQAEALSDIALVATRAGRYEHAERIVRNIRSTDDRVWPLTKLAQALAESGNRRQAQKVAEDAEAAARSIVDPVEEVMAYIRFVQALIRVGDKKRAESLAKLAEKFARRIHEEDVRLGFMTAIVQSYVEVGAHSQAQEAARQTITDPYSLDPLSASFMMVETLAAVGAAAEARNLCHDARIIAESIFHQDDVEQLIKDLERSIEHSEQPGSSFKEKANKLHSMDDPGSRAYGLANLARQLYDTGRLSEAEQLAREAGRISHNLPNSGRKALTMGQLATTGRSREVAQRQAQQAIQAARELSNADERAATLTGLAGILGRPFAGALLAEALTIGPWHQPMTILAELYPQVILCMADIVCDPVDSASKQDSLDSPNSECAKYASGKA
jgi:tetratricopeptide (TPR) repeat protein